MQERRDSFASGSYNGELDFVLLLQNFSVILNTLFKPNFMQIFLLLSKCVTNNISLATVLA